MPEETLQFLVHGSAPVPYQVTFIRPGEGELFAYCTCPAGEHGQYCKHRFNIMAGSDKKIISNNRSAVSEVVNWLQGTELEAEILRMKEMEAEVERLRKILSEQKKQVARVMRGHS